MAEKSHDRILRYLDEHGVVDKDAQGRRQGSRRARGRAARSAGSRTLDLHGLTAERADIVLRQTLQRCRRDGVQSLLVIHGQGHHCTDSEGSVLRRLVRMRIEGDLSHLVRDHRKAPPARGGDGATLVYL
jgi:DNA-nicking Smr family endonuclease